MEKVIEIRLKMILNVKPKYKRRLNGTFCASIVYFHCYKDKIPSYVSFFRLGK